jgi:probable F420-dependent oxidoreductase
VSPAGDSIIANVLNFDLPLGLDRVRQDPGGFAAAAEADGIDGVWSAEAGHDPFLPLVQVAAATRRLHFGTAIAVAFARSPMVHAQVAWDLHRLAPGRFILGLGAQVRAHNERRYGVPGDRPAARMRDLIRAIRAIWTCFQEGGRLRYHGEFFDLSLMTPFFNPGPVEADGPPKIYLAAVTEIMLRVAGAEADGVHVHPLHSERHLDSVVLPTARKAAIDAGRSGDAMEFAVPAMIATGRSEFDLAESMAAMRAQVAFYASTPAYRGVLEIEDRGDLADRLHALSRRGAWGEMADLVDDELLRRICTVATWDDLPAALVRRYAGRATRLMPYAVGDDATPWPEIARAVKSAAI